VLFYLCTMVLILDCVLCMWVSGVSFFLVCFGLLVAVVNVVSLFCVYGSVAWCVSKYTWLWVQCMCLW